MINHRTHRTPRQQGGSGEWQQAAAVRIAFGYFSPSCGLALRRFPRSRLPPWSLSIRQSVSRVRRCSANGLRMAAVPWGSKSLSMWDAVTLRSLEPDLAGGLLRYTDGWQQVVTITNQHIQAVGGLAEDTAEGHGALQRCR